MKYELEVYVTARKLLVVDAIDEEDAIDIGNDIILTDEIPVYPDDIEDYQIVDVHCLDDEDIFS